MRQFEYVCVCVSKWQEVCFTQLLQQTPDPPPTPSISNSTISPLINKDKWSIAIRRCCSFLHVVPSGKQQAVTGRLRIAFKDLMMAGSIGQVIEVADAFCHLTVISLSQSDTYVDSWPSMRNRLISACRRKEKTPQKNTDSFVSKADGW